MRLLLSSCLALAAHDAWSETAGAPLLVADADQPQATVGILQSFEAADSQSATIQVATPAGQAVGTCILSALPGEPTLIAFDCSAQAPSYQLQRGVAAPAWQPQAGVVVETRHRVDGPADTYEQGMALWPRCVPKQGTTLVPNIFLGINPCGETLDFAANFSGYFSVPTAGSYRFATISDDASFIAIDGAVLVQWGGWHGYDGGMHGEHGAAIQLSAGVHQLQYLYFQNGDNPVQEVVWTPPGQERPEVMPPAAFLPVATWHLQADPPTTGALTWRILGSSRMSGLSVETYEFATALPAGASAHWRFADGGDATGERVAHTFCVGGLRSVHLEISSPGTATRVLDQLVAIHALWSQVEEWSDDWNHRARQELLGRDPRQMPAADVLAELRYANTTQDVDWVKSVALSAAADPTHWGADGGELDVELGFRLQSPEIGCYQQAADCWHAALQVMTGHSAVREHMSLHYAGLLVQGLDQGKQGEAVLSGIDVSLLDGGEARLFKLYQGDAALANGDVDAARGHYRDAGDVVDPANLAYGVRRRMRLEAAKSWCTSGDYDQALQEMRNIEWETPMERLGIETGLIKVRAYVGLKEIPFALSCCRHLLVAIGPDERRAEVLRALVTTCLAGDDRAQAIDVAKVLIKDHPYSEAAAQVKELLPETSR